MLGIRLGTEIRVIRDEVIITVVIRDTGELRSISMPYQLFIKKLLGNRSWWRKDFVVDRISAESITKDLYSD